MLEKMDEFFSRRLEGYEEHQLQAIDQARTFYPLTAACLPNKENARILDLGCGTGLELGYYFDLNPTARVTGIDLSREMLNALQAKFPHRDLTLVHGSYFDLPLGHACYDAAVSVESLHHFTQAEKIPLYRKLVEALTADGYFILTDYFAEDDAQETFFQQELLRLKAEQGLCDGEFYHYDTPLTVEHEIQALKQAGFAHVEVLGQWSATRLLKAFKKPSAGNR